MVPSVDEAIEVHALLPTLFEVHVTPEFVEIQIGPATARDAAAANLLPSADEATETQVVLGALVCVHVVPEFVDFQMPVRLVATNLVPSAEEATVVQ